MQGILYVAHGSRTEEGVAEAKTFIGSIMKKVPAAIQETSFLELSAPTIEEGFKKCVKRGATSVTVVPLLLGGRTHETGYSGDSCPPAEGISRRGRRLERCGRGTSGHFGRPCGNGRTAGSRRPSRRYGLACGAGSSDPSVRTACEKIAAGLAERLGVQNTSTCYLASARPCLDEGMQWAVNTTLQGRKIMSSRICFFRVCFFQKYPRGKSIPPTGGARLPYRGLSAVMKPFYKRSSKTLWERRQPAMQPLLIQLAGKKAVIAGGENGRP